MNLYEWALPFFSKVENNTEAEWAIAVFVRVGNHFIEHLWRQHRVASAACFVDNRANGRNDIPLTKVLILATQCGIEFCP